MKKDFLQLFAAPENMTGTAQIRVRAREIDFVSSFQNDYQALQDVMGITRPIRKANGTLLKVKKAKGVLQNGRVPEGEIIPLSRYEVEEAVYDSIELEKFRKGVSIEAIAEHGYDAAITMTDDEMKADLRNEVMRRFYHMLNKGTLISVEDSFQMAVAMAIAKITNKFKALHKTPTGTVLFVNVLDAYRYLGAAEITTQTAFGMNYIKDFLGASIVFFGTDADGINQGTVYATPVNNIVSYYVDPSDSEFARAGLSFTTQGDVPLVGFHAEGNYERDLSEMFALMGFRLFAEYLDAIAKISFGNGGVGIAPETNTILGTDPADIQSGIAIAGNSMTGVSKLLKTGPIVEAWGEGNFVALKFTLPEGVAYGDVKVGLVPSEGSGLVTLDADLNGVFKISDNDAQDFKVVYEKNGETVTKIVNLAGVVCEKE